MESLKVLIKKPIEITFDFDEDDFYVDKSKCADIVNETIDNTIYDESVLQLLLSEYNEQFESGLKITDILEFDIDENYLYMQITTNQKPVEDDMEVIDDLVYELFENADFSNTIEISGDVDRDNFDLNGFYQTVEHIDTEGEFNVELSSEKCFVDKVQ